MFVVLSQLAGVSPSGVGSWWFGLVSIVSIISAATLASYLPRPGAGPGLDLGCTPCAAVAALAVLASAGVLTSMPPDLPNGILALGIAMFGLVQRLRSPASCVLPESADLGSADVGQRPGGQHTHQAEDSQEAQRHLRAELSQRTADRAGDQQ
jgi:hypothetical protein